MVLLQRDQRKVRMQQEKKKKGKEAKLFAPPAGASAGAPTAAADSGDASAPSKGAKQVHETLRERIEPEGGYADDDPRKEWAASLRDAIIEKKRLKREERGFKTKGEMAWAPQLKGAKLEEQQSLRDRLGKDPDSLTAAERERAELLVARDARKRMKKAQRAEQRAKREAAANGGVPPTDSQISLARKWGFSEKMAAAAAARLKKGLKRGDWECPKCKNKNFARRDKCLKCDESVPTDHSRWASLGSKEFEDHDAHYWEEKQKEHLKQTGVAADAIEPKSDQTAGQHSDLWHCKKCGIGNAESVTVCFRCGKHKGSKKLDTSGMTLAGKIAAASGTEGDQPQDKRKQREEKKAARLGAKLSAQAEASTQSGSSSSSSSSSSDDDSSSDDEAVAVANKKKRSAPTEAADSSSDSSSSDSDDDDDAAEEEPEGAKKEIGFTGSGRDTSGDWTCPRCSNLNWNNREKCNRCPQLRGEKPPPTPEELKKAKEAAAAEKKKRKKQAAKEAAAEAAANTTSSAEKDDGGGERKSKGKCVLGSKDPPGGGDVENKTYTCAGCGVSVKGACECCSALFYVSLFLVGVRDLSCLHSR